MAEGDVQVKVYVTPKARQTLRDKSDALGMTQSDVAEELFVRGSYPDGASVASGGDTPEQ